MSCINYDYTQSNECNRDNSNQSDRQYPSNSKLNRFRIVHRFSSSKKATKTSLKPGALCPGGKGVDVKHNSYDRYLARKKKPLIIKDKERKEIATELKTPLCRYGCRSSSSSSSGITSTSDALSAAEQALADAAAAVENEG